MDLQIRQLQQDEWDAYAHTVQIGLSFQATEEALAEWKRMFEFDRSEPVSILNASESSIYGRFGYGPAAFRAELQIDRPHTAFALPVDVTGRVRLLDRSEALKVIPGVYERHRLAQPGELSRPLT